MTYNSSAHNIVNKDDVNNAKKEVVMRRKQRFGLLLMLMSVTACAPVVYDATYHKHRTPTHVVVRSTHSQPSRHHEPVYRQIHPIEITLYAGNTYLGVNFQPIQIVIADGEYVKIPIRNKRGRQTIIYAHYHEKSLHFDADRNCRNLHGSSKYKYDKRWNKGRKYTRINAGKDYDLTGLQLRIRNVPTGKRQTTKYESTKVINQKVIILNNSGKKSSKQQVTRVLVKNNGKKPSIHNKQLMIDSHPAKASDYYARDKQMNKAKTLTTKETLVVKAVKKAKRPVIVERISRHRQKKDDLIHKRGKKQSEEIIVKNKSQLIKADHKTGTRNIKSRSTKR
jgi:hypothetical protein